MASYRITKYDPAYRNDLGAYTKDEWTSYSDIGKSFSGGTLTLNEYLRMEAAYIDAIERLSLCEGIKSFKIQHIEKISDPLDENSNEEMLDLYNSIRHNDIVEIDSIRVVCKLLLREYMLGELISKSMRVGFGQDYYLYVKLSRRCIDDFIYIKSLCLFVEPGPYIFIDHFTIDEEILLSYNINHEMHNYLQLFDIYSSLKLIQLCKHNDIGIMSIQGMRISGYIDNDKSRPLYDTPSSVDYSELYDSSTEEEFSQKSVEEARKFFEKETDRQLVYDFRLGCVDIQFKVS